MSFGPSPYQPPGVDYFGAQPGGPDMLAPCRRAGMLQMILGGLSLICAFFRILVVMMTPTEEFMRQMPMALPPGVTARQLIDAAMIMVMVISVILAGLWIGMGWFVRRGSHRATVGSIVITAIILGLSVLGVLVTLGAMAASGAAALLAAGCAAIIQAGVLLWLLLWLIPAAKVSKSMQAMRKAHQAQYGQYAMYSQQQQPPTGGGYGYGQPQQPPPPGGDPNPPAQ